MKVTILGFKMFGYKKDGKQKNAKVLYFARDPLSKENDVVGMVAGEVWVFSRLSDDQPVEAPLYAKMNSECVGKPAELVYEFDGRRNDLVDILVEDVAKPKAS